MRDVRCVSCRRSSRFVSDLNEMYGGLAGAFGSVSVVMVRQLYHRYCHAVHTNARFYLVFDLLSLSLGLCRSIRERPFRRSTRWEIAWISWLPQASSLAQTSRSYGSARPTRSEEHTSE